MTLAVSAMIGTSRLPRGKWARIYFVASMPSISGICTSIRTRSNGKFCSSVIASRPFEAICTEPHRESYYATYRRALFGYTRYLRLIAHAFPAAIAASSEAVSSGSTITLSLGYFVGNRNREFRTFPGSLVTPIWPPCNSTKLREIVSPSPVPPYLREVSISACEKESKTDLSLSRGIPIPVSRTASRTFILFSPAAAASR